MLTYFLMGLPFIAFVLLLDTVILKTWVIKKRDTWIIMAIMLGLTAVFDQFLTGIPLVFYNQAHISGIKLWHAPIEDFSYTIVLVIGIGAILSYGKKPSSKKSAEST